MSEGRIRVMSGTGVLSADQIRGFLADVLIDCEIDTRVLVHDNPSPTPHVPTEIELWNAAVDARKAAKRNPAPTGDHKE